MALNAFGEEAEERLRQLGALKRVPRLRQDTLKSVLLECGHLPYSHPSREVALCGSF